MNIFKLQPAYVIHSRRFRETSLIVDCLTKDYGRISLLAKGVINKKSLKLGLLQQFSPILIAWRGRGDLPTISALEAASPVKKLQGQSIFCGLYINEILLKLTDKGESHNQLFPIYSACMQDLLEAKNKKNKLQESLRRFEVGLLEELGLGMQLSLDQDRVAINPLKEYYYEMDSGPTSKLKNNKMIDGASLLALARGKFDNDRQRHQALILMRKAIAYHLGGRTIKSRELFREIYQAKN
tara:strand:+ start:1794 stop:2513 length:720 start_codon:yes stop_codon:yes gene_type:complete